MMKIKIYDGTQPDAHLCESCAASVIRLEGSRKITLCREMPYTFPIVRGRVTQCSSYHPITAARAMNEYQANAWYLDRDEDGSLVWSTPAERENPFKSASGRKRRRNPSRTNAINPETVQ